MLPSFPGLVARSLINGSHWLVRFSSQEAKSWYRRQYVELDLAPGPIHPKGKAIFSHNNIAGLTTGGSLTTCLYLFWGALIRALFQRG